MLAVVSVLMWCLLGAMTIVYFALFLLPTVLTLPFDRNRRIAHAIASLWGRTARLIHPAWGIRRHGFEHVRNKGPFVICANHQSVLDILALFQLPGNFKWISKAVNFKVPFMGWYMHFAGYIPLVRGDRESIAACMARAEWWLRRGVSVAFFPEGTRSPDGELLPFKLGAFRLAIATGCPVLPVTLARTRDVLPKGEWRVPPRVQSVFWVDEAIPTGGLGVRDAEALAGRTREVIAARLQAIGGGAPVKAAQRQPSGQASQAGAARR